MFCATVSGGIEMTTELTHYIDGQNVKGGSGRFADVMNPATGEVQGRVPRG